MLFIKVINNSTLLVRRRIKTAPGMIHEAVLSTNQQGSGQARLEEVRHADVTLRDLGLLGSDIGAALKLGLTVARTDVHVRAL